MLLDQRAPLLIQVLQADDLLRIDAGRGRKGVLVRRRLGEELQTAVS